MTTTTHSTPAAFNLSAYLRHTLAKRLMQQYGLSLRDATKKTAVIIIRQQPFFKGA